VVGGNQTFDIRGAVLFNVSDTGLLPSPLAITDSTGGTDPGATTLPFGNAFLIGSDANTGTSGIADILFFDFSHAVAPLPTLLIVPAIVSVTPTGSNPGPVLSTLTSSSPVPFVFTFSAFQDLGNGDGILQWQLSGIAPTPEPQSWFLMGMGCIGLAVFGFRKTRTAAR
jgi:hypothetical protein